MVLTVILTIAGCASTRNIGPEDALKDPSSLDAGVTLREANADAGWPSSAWWRSYNDPQLDAWIARAQAGNPSLALAAARVREARSLAGVADRASGAATSAAADRSAGLPSWSGRVAGRSADPAEDPAEALTDDERLEGVPD